MDVVNYASGFSLSEPSRNAVATAPSAPAAPSTQKWPGWARVTFALGAGVLSWTAIAAAVMSI